MKRCKENAWLHHYVNCKLYKRDKWGRELSGEIHFSLNLNWRNSLLILLSNANGKQTFVKVIKLQRWRDCSDAGSVQPAARLSYPVALKFDLKFK